MQLYKGDNMLLKRYRQIRLTTLAPPILNTINRSSLTNFRRTCQTFGALPGPEPHPLPSYPI